MFDYKPVMKICSL